MATTDNYTYENCINYAKISGDLVAGGLIGSTIMSNTTMTNCVNLGNVSSTKGQWLDFESYAGGLVGGAVFGATYMKIHNCVNLGNVYGVDNAGGLCGLMTDVEIYGYSVSFGNVSGNYAAGFVVSSDNVNIYECKVGGLIQGVEVGAGMTDATRGAVKNCYVYAEIYGRTADSVSTSRSVTNARNQIFGTVTTTE